MKNCEVYLRHISPCRETIRTLGPPKLVNPERSVSEAESEGWPYPGPNSF